MKAIRFNLKINEQIVRNLEELKENFVIQEVYSLYKKGILQRWLKQQGHEGKKKFIQLKQLKSESLELDKIKMLSQILIDANTEDLVEVEMMYHYFLEQESNNQSFQQLSNNRRKYLNEVIQQYRKDVDELTLIIDSALSRAYRKPGKKNNANSKSSDRHSIYFNKLKSIDSEQSLYDRKKEVSKEVIDEIIYKVNKKIEFLVKNYYPLLKLNFFQLERRFESRPIILVLMLSNKRLRHLFTESVKQGLYSQLDDIYTNLNTFSVIGVRDLTIGQKELYIFIHVYKGSTEGLWSNIENPKEQVIVLKLKDGVVGTEKDKTIELTEENREDLLTPFNQFLFKSNDSYSLVWYLRLGEESLSDR